MYMPRRASRKNEPLPYWYKKEPNEERDRELAEREAKRMARSKELEQRVQELKEKGNTAFKAGDYLAAKELYRIALNATDGHLRLSLPILLNATQTLLKLNQPEEAEDLASVALGIDPKNIKARYRRGLARRARGFYHAAAIDFEAVLELDPNCKEAKAELKACEEEWKKAGPHACGHEDGHTTEDDEEPAINDTPLNSESDDDESDSSDSNHTGNGTPCRYYNQSRCKRGKDCKFSHAPDVRAVRDKLGRNVCLNFLLGQCTHSLDRCYFSHSTAYLPVEQRNGKPYRWWKDKNAVRDRAYVQGIVESELLLAETLDPGCTGMSDGTRRALERQNEREANGGFTNAQLEELMCQGVKPWEDDAWDVLDALGCL